MELNKLKLELRMTPKYLCFKNDVKAIKNHVDTEEVKYLNLINSENWFIMNQTNVKHNVLVTMFQPENCMVWMNK